MVRDHLEQIEENIRTICAKSNRRREDVVLVAVSKHHPPEKIMEAYQWGCRDFGENRVQELLEKTDRLPSDIRWHLIGHLQRNKVKYIIDKVYMIHSVDSYRLAEEISKEAVKKKCVVKVLIQVNVAEEESKYGIGTQEAGLLAEQAAGLPGIQVEGLMIIAPFVENAEDNRRYFSELRQLYVDIRKKNIDNMNMNVLSMGMSGDYMTAIEEGAGMIRIGTGIFKD